MNAEATQANVLISNFADSRADARVELSLLPWSGDTTAEIRIVDSARNLDLMQTENLPAQNANLSIHLPHPAIALLKLRRPERRKHQLTITLPANRIVFQRNHEGRAAIPIEGTASFPGGWVEARLIPVDYREQAGEWERVTQIETDGTFGGRLSAPAGWYQMEFRAGSSTNVLARARVEQVGVGEVFIVAGHSVAQAGDINLPGSIDDRVNTIPLAADASSRPRDYERTGDLQFLPELLGTPFASGVRPAPFGHGTYFWAQFAERIAQNKNVLC